MNLGGFGLCTDCELTLQDDCLYPQLTVKETLEYAAYLRLPSSMTSEEKKKRALDVANEVQVMIFRCSVSIDAALH